MLKNPNKKELDKSASEKAWASILLRYLNNEGYDYVIRGHSIPSGMADVDVFASSNSDKYPPLYIQLCLDVEPKNEGYEEIMKIPKTYTFNNCDNALGAIKGKIKKYKEHKRDFSQITLAVQSIGSYFIENDERYIIGHLKKACEELKRKHKDVGFFKGIYLLSKRGEICDGQTTKEDSERVFQIL